MRSLFSCHRYIIHSSCVYLNVRSIFFILFLSYTVGQHYLYKYYIQENYKSYQEELQKHNKLLLEADLAIYDLIKISRGQEKIIQQQQILIKKYQKDLYYNQRAFYEQN